MTMNSAAALPIPEVAEAGAAVSTPWAAAPVPSRSNWLEDYRARLNGAVAWLTQRGMRPVRVSADAVVATWEVPGWRGTFENGDLIKLAERYGFGMEATSG